MTNIEQYYNEVKHKYNVDLEEFKKICKSPFRFVKHVMASGVLKNIRFQYFGIFKVSPSKVKFSKKKLEENYNKGVISKERYEKRLNVLNNYEN